MSNDLEFDSEFCNVIYIEKDNTVFLSWKKFARLNDYREPTLFGLYLLRQHAMSNFIVDARHGFEDDPADVEWGFSELLSKMAKTDCNYVVFIMEKVPTIKEEMDMWTKEFSKYFTVMKVANYEEAIQSMNNVIKLKVK